jgi:hypothetical protein
MFARIELCLATVLLMAVAGGASADSYQPSVGSIPPSSANPVVVAPQGTPAYSQSGTTDPYNRSDFTSEQSFGLTAAQMLGAAAACEQLHSDRVSMSGQQITKASRSASEEERANLDAAQQYMLDPAATLPNNLSAGEADCDRMSASFSQLQQIQLHNQYLSKELDQPDAVSPSKSNNRPR